MTGDSSCFGDDDAGSRRGVMGGSGRLALVQQLRTASGRASKAQSDLARVTSQLRGLALCLVEPIISSRKKKTMTLAFQFSLDLFENVYGPIIHVSDDVENQLLMRQEYLRQLAERTRHYHRVPQAGYVEHRWLVSLLRNNEIDFFMADFLVVYKRSNCPEFNFRGFRDLGPAVESYNQADPLSNLG